MNKFNEWVILRKWKESRLLEGVGNPVGCALALEGQRLHNEQEMDDTDHLARFKRLSIPIIRRLFNHCISPIQGSPEQLPEWYVCEDISLYVPPMDIQHNLDEEANYCANAAIRLARRIDELAGDQKLTLHCIALEQMGAVSVFKINYSIEDPNKPVEIDLNQLSRMELSKLHSECRMNRDYENADVVRKLLQDKFGIVIFT